MSEEKRNATDAAQALALGAASRDKADAYLEKQTRLAALQLETLEREEPFQLSHLRWRRFEDQMKGATRIMLVGLGALFVIAIGAMLWNASRADGWVVDAFTVPPAMEARGVTGNMVAEDITARLTAIRTVAASNALNTVAQVSRDSGDAIKVEIPQTGVSLAEGWRFLKSWLGHERHLRGSLRPDGEGRLQLSIAMDGMAPASFSGASADLGNLEQQAAEHVFGASDTMAHGLYLMNNGRHDEALAFLAAKARTATTPMERYLTQGVRGEMARLITGDLRQAIARSQVTRAIQPAWFGSWLTGLRAHRDADHQEAAIAFAAGLLALKEKDQPEAFWGPGWISMQFEAQSMLDRSAGDYTALANDAAKVTGLGENVPAFVVNERANAAAGMHDLTTARGFLAQAGGEGDALPQSFATAMGYGNAKAALRAINDFDARADTSKYTGAGYKAWRKLTFSRPRRAEALALGGDMDAAEKEIAPTPLDCDYCVRARGKIAAARRDWTGAARWFALVSARSPHVPFPDTDWGRVLLAKGDADGAIAKFESAHAKGPHLADPMELWGEALMAKNQSHLAVKKFAEAEKYAPNWGRLHLKWGEALIYMGEKDAAQKQFARARELDLTPSEKSALARLP